MSDQPQNPPSPEEPARYSPPPPPPGGGYQPAPPPMSGASTTGQPADVGIRLLARIIDYIILGIALTLIDVLVIGAIWNSNGSTNLMGTGNGYAGNAVSGVVSAVVYLAYFTLMESGQGRTLGKMILKLQTRGASGGRPSTEEAFRRNIWVATGLLAVIPVVGSYAGGILELVAIIAIIVTVSQSPTKQGWHDRFAGGTSVARL